MKTSEGIKINGKSDCRIFSFHPKIRYNMGDEIFYVWIAIFNDKQDKKAHFYIFNTKDVQRFDNFDLKTYQITDNQKISLIIREDGAVLNKGKIYSYSCFNSKFYNDWNSLELEINNSSS